MLCCNIAKLKKNEPKCYVCILYTITTTLFSQMILMETTHLKLALAALCHDLGKFTEGGMDLSPSYMVNNEQIYQPLWDGRYTHRHALYTAAFIEEYGDKFPRVCNEDNWGNGDSFINLAACHHKPESAMQLCVTMADRLSSGMDRATFNDSTNIPFTEYRSTRLVSVLEALTPEQDEQLKFEKSNNYTTQYPLAPLSATNCFPVPHGKISKNKAKDEYQQLFDSFLIDIAKLPHRDSPSLWSQHFDSLLATYCSQIPAARVGGVVPDVSLYDHLRTTASLAVPLYIYHQQTDTCNEKAIKDETEEKYLLVSGDFYGIQDFIFAAGGEQQRLRAKLLRGRSFAVSLFSELAADALCRALDLPFTAVFLNVAGKFHILAANTEETRKTIKQETAKLHQWLMDISYGQASIGVTTTPASPEQFVSHNGAFIQLWDHHLANMDRQKYQRIHLNQYGVVTDFLSSFDNDLDKPLCPFCGKRPAHKNAEHDHYLKGKGSACEICRDHIMLGTNLVKGHGLAIYHGKPTSISPKKQLLQPFFKEYQLVFYKDAPTIHDGPLLKFWQLGVKDDGTLPAGGTLHLLNGYVPTYRPEDMDNDQLQRAVSQDDETIDIEQLIKNKEPKTFNDLAILAKGDKRGTAALGVLKADVDNLGLLMSCGLPERRFTISRMATLSRRLDQFFSLYLPHLLNSNPQFQNVYTVFAGGDDLFLIGPWNQMANLAAFLREKWHHYVSANDKDGGLTFSAGITMHKNHVPVDKLAKTAEEALEQAKDKDLGKNNITMFAESIKWQTFADLRQKQQVMEGWLSKEYISSVMLYRFNTFISMAGKARQISRGGQTIQLQDMDCLKWRALLKYSLARNVKGRGEERDNALSEVSILADWLEKYDSALKIALWTQLYEKR